VQHQVPLSALGAVKEKMLASTYALRDSGLQMMGLAVDYDT
jgi:hypothetical protein